MIPSFDTLDRIEQQEILGEFLFPYILKKVGDKYAPMITGMLIDLPTSECLEEVSSLQLLSDKWEEAVDLLRIRRVNIDHFLLISIINHIFINTVFDVV